MKVTEPISIGTNNEGKKIFTLIPQHYSLTLFISA